MTRRTAGFVHGVVLALALAGLGACGKKKAAGPPPAPTVIAAHPLQRPIVDWDDYTGRFEAMDTGALESIVDEVIAANAAEWDQYCAGDDKTRKKLSGFFTGQIMKASKGQADGRAVAQLLAQKSAG